MGNALTLFVSMQLPHKSSSGLHAEAVLNVRVALIDDQAIVAQGVAAMLRNFPGVRVDALFASVSAALAATEVLRTLDLLLVDYHLSEVEETRRLVELRERFPALPCVWLSGAVSTAALLQIQSLGFRGFVHKDDEADELRAAIAAVAEGRIYESPTARRLLREVRTESLLPKVLSAREQEVLACIGAGDSNETIAGRLGLSPTTVQTHRRNIMGKLNLRTSVALQVYAQQNGYVAGAVEGGRG